MFINFKDIFKVSAKCLLFLFFFLSFASCEKEDRIGELTSSKISIEKAIDDLNSVLADIDNGTKSNVRKIASISVIGEGDFSAQTKSGDNLIDSLLYLVNFEGNRGYAVLAADSRIPTPVIMVADTGSFSKNKFSGNDINEIQSFTGKLLSDYAMNSISPGGDDTGGDNPNYPNHSIYPLIKTKWGQKSPFNDQCPIVNGKRAVAGCVAIAVSQIMNKFQYPKVYGGYSYKWDKIGSIIYDFNGDTEARSEVARFVHNVGVESNMNYGETSGTTSADAKRCFQQMGYKNVVKYNSYREDIIMDMLRSAKPVYISAQTQWFFGTGHAWVIDGYMYSSKHQQHLLHCNYGWKGLCDGYYATKAFLTTQGPLETEDAVDGENTGTSYNNYKYYYRIINYNL